MNINEYMNKYYGKSPKIKANLRNITDIYQDLKEDGVFVSINGKSSCELNNIVEAINKKPAAIFVEKGKKLSLKDKIPVITVESPKMELARLLKFENDAFDKKPIFIGITGTNGKTTTTYIVYQYLKYQNYDVLLIGTNWIYSYFKMEEKTEETNNTTPSLSLLYKYLRNTENEYDYVIMEISSQGIEEGRIEGLNFNVVGLTNLSAEHLDYHHTLTEYRTVKSKLFKQINNPSWESYCILNEDDDSFNYYKDKCLGKLLTYGINSGMIKAINLNVDHDESNFIIVDQNEKYEIHTNLVGKFNVYNILMVWSLNKALHLRKKDLMQFLNKKIEIPGRMQVVKKNDRTFIIDFAHTIKAVENVLKAINNIKNNNMIITVIGCGGMRDRLKRPIIGSLACTYSDYVIFTEDNSRDENTMDIIEEITKDLNTNNYRVILDRKVAVEEAYKLSNKNDTILLLGKGIEKYQIGKNNVKIPYSELDAINSLGNNYEYLL